MIRRVILTLLILVLIVAAGLATAALLFRHPTPAQFAAASARQPVQLARDQAAHFNMRTEWWYYTGFLRGAGASQYGFELVFFKAYLPAAVRLPGGIPLNLFSNPLYFAHLAISDQAAGDHAVFVESSFPQFWQAGTARNRFEVWNGDWRAWGSGGEHHLAADAGDVALWLDLSSPRPPVLHGPDGTGVVDMGRAGTSYYYSYPDLSGVGVLRVNGALQGVQATAWMDHQWGSWAQHGDFAGWDWFSLRLDDGTRLMLFGFRDEGGAFQAESAGTWIAPDGSAQHLELGDFSVQPAGHWSSPQTGGVYPVKWNVEVPGRGFSAVVEATFPDQEVIGGPGPTYWEGTVTVGGAQNGNGFVEMTGYAPAGGQ